MKSSPILALCHGGMICVAIVINLMPVYFTTFSEEFGGLNEEQLGRISALMFAGIVLGILLCGPLADRFGARLFTLSGLAIAALGLILIALSWNYETLLVASVVAGLGAGILDMIMSPIVSAVCHNRRASALNRLHAYFCVGAVGTVLAASAGLRFGVSWRLVSAGLAVIPLALFAGFALVALPPLVHPDHSREGLRRLLLRPRFLLALAAIILIGATEAGIMQWLPAFSERVLGYEKATGAIALAVFCLAMAAGRLLASRNMHHASPYRLIFTACLLCIALYLLGCLLPLPASSLAALILIGFSCSVLWPTWLGITADRFPRGGASMFALLAASGNFGCLVLPWVIGVIAEHAGLRTGLLAGTLAPVLLAGLAAASWHADRKKGLVPG